MFKLKVVFWQMNWLIIVNNSSFTLPTLKMLQKVILKTQAIISSVLLMKVCLSNLKPSQSNILTLRVSNIPKFEQKESQLRHRSELSKNVCLRNSLSIYIRNHMRQVANK